MSDDKDFRRLLKQIDRLKAEFDFFTKEARTELIRENSPESAIKSLEVAIAKAREIAELQKVGRGEK